MVQTYRRLQSVSALASRSVQRVDEALAAAGATGHVVELESTARTAADAAAALGVPTEAIVKSLVFTVDDHSVLALVAGDRRCRIDNLPVALGRKGRAERASARTVREATGFAIGGVPPLGHTTLLPVVIDASIGRFSTVYAAAGHPHCVFATTFVELCRLTGGRSSETIAEA